MAELAFRIVDAINPSYEPDVRFARHTERAQTDEALGLDRDDRHRARARRVGLGPSPVLALSEMPAIL